jgi:hypothetical protein
LLRTGNPEEAGRLAAEAWQILSALGYAGLEPHALRLRAEIARAGGTASPDQVELALSNAAARAQALGMPLEFVRTRTCLARLHLEQGARRSAYDLLVQARDLLAEAPKVPVVEEIEHLLETLA